MPRLQVLLAAFCFGTTGTAQALGPDGASPLTVGAVRVALGAALLLLAVRLAAGSEPLRLARRPLAVGGLGGWLLNRTKPGSAWAVATALAAVGVALMALSGLGRGGVGARGGARARRGCLLRGLHARQQTPTRCGRRRDRVMAGVLTLGAFSPRARWPH